MLLVGPLGGASVCLFGWNAGAFACQRAREQRAQHFRATTTRRYPLAGASYKLDYMRLPQACKGLES